MTRIRVTARTTIRDRDGYKPHEAQIIRLLAPLTDKELGQAAARATNADAVQGMAWELGRRRTVRRAVKRARQVEEVDRLLAELEPETPAQAYDRASRVLFNRP